MGPAWHDLACALHVHTSCSDGTATPLELVEAARRSGTDVVVVCDHDTLAARPFQGWHDGVLLVVALEISPRGGHLLAFGIDEPVAHDDRDERELVAEVRRRGGFAIAAHAFSEGSAISRRIGRPHGWGALDDPDLAGVEVWSLFTDTAEECTNPLQLLHWLRRPEDLAISPGRRLGEWDRLGARRRVAGVGGLDAHQKPGLRVGGRLFAVQRHERGLGLLRTHVLLGQPPAGDERDVAAVLDALREGRCYLALDFVADARGTAFWADGPAGEAAMGAEVALADGPWELHARVPRRARLRLVRDGEPLAEREADRLDLAVEGAGVHRLEAWVEHGGVDRAWVLTNPVYVRETLTENTAVNA